MIVSFIGCPGSGKTTLAFKLYAALKEREVACEFLQEQARLYIAEARVDQCLDPQDQPALDDEDQYEIMDRQLFLEQVLRKAVGQHVLLVTDSSPLNSLLYMTPEGRRAAAGLAAKTLAAGGLTFYCAPVALPVAADPNRIHTEAQAHTVDETIMPVLSEYAPYVLNSMVYLDGDLETRFRTLLNTVLGALP